jgi:hypothetical protein
MHKIQIFRLKGPSITIQRPADAPPPDVDGHLGHKTGTHRGIVASRGAGRASKLTPGCGHEKSGCNPKQMALITDPAVNRGQQRLNQSPESRADNQIEEDSTTAAADTFLANFWSDVNAMEDHRKEAWPIPRVVFSVKGQRTEAQLEVLRGQAAAFTVKSTSDLTVQDEPTLIGAH